MTAGSRPARVSIHQFFSLSPTSVVHSVRAASTLSKLTGRPSTICHRGRFNQSPANQAATDEMNRNSRCQYHFIVYQFTLPLIYSHDFSPLPAPAKRGRVETVEIETSGRPIMQNEKETKVQGRSEGMTSFIIFVSILVLLGTLALIWFLIQLGIGSFHE